MISSNRVWTEKESKGASLPTVELIADINRISCLMQERNRATWRERTSKLTSKADESIDEYPNQKCY